MSILFILITLTAVGLFGFARLLGLGFRLIGQAWVLLRPSLDERLPRIRAGLGEVRNGEFTRRHDRFLSLAVQGTYNQKQATTALLLTGRAGGARGETYGGRSSVRPRLSNQNDTYIIGDQLLSSLTFRWRARQISQTLGGPLEATPVSERFLLSLGGAVPGGFGSESEPNDYAQTL